MNSILFPISRGSHRSVAGFNLIEVTLAVAIVAVGMLTVLGLLGGGIESSRRISDETLLAHLSDDMFNWARITPFEKQSFLPSGASLTNRNSSVPEDGLDANGNFSVTEHQDPNAYWTGKYFRFTYTPLDHPQYPGKDITRVLVTVEWPVNPATGAAVTNANRRYFVSQVARKE